LNHNTLVPNASDGFHSSGSHALASRKFNVFISFFVREVYLRAFGDDERESQALAARASALEDHALGSGHEQFADRAPPRAAPAVSVPDNGEPEDPR